MHGTLKDKKYTKHESERAKLKMDGGCWTINLQELSDMEFGWLEIVTARHTYLIEKNFAFSVGSVKSFKGETKLVVPIRYWETK